MPDPLFHIARRADWDAARPGGRYEQSTLGRTLAEEGFVHCSTQLQLADTGHRFYADVTDELVVLVIDPSRLRSEVRLEPAPDGSGPFPHVYGPIDVDAVADVIPVRAGGGEFVVRWPYEP